MLQKSMLTLLLGLSLLAVAGCGKDKSPDVQRGGFKRLYVPTRGKKPPTLESDNPGPVRRPRLRD